MLEEQDKRDIEIVVKRILKNDFSKRIGDTPTDNLQLVPRKYVNLNGLVANRPTSSVATVGQSYFATDTKIPMTYTGTNWVNGVGSIVAST